MIACEAERDVITVTGPDASKYLNGQLSQEVAAIGIGDSRWSLLLEPKGQINTWLRVSTVGESEYWLDLDAGFGHVALARLERFLIRTKVEMSLAALPWIALRPEGDTAAEPLPVDRATVGSGVQVVARSADGRGLDLLGSDAVGPDDARRGTPEDLEAYRIASGVPAMGYEITEKTLPAEVGLVEVSVDFDKGCYVGQELVTRMHSRGNNPPKPFYRLELSGGIDPAALADGGTARIVQDDLEVGALTSAASSSGGVIGLGFLKRSADLSGSLAVGDQAEPVTISVLDRLSLST